MDSLEILSEYPYEIGTFLVTFLVLGFVTAYFLFGQSSTPTKRQVLLSSATKAPPAKPGARKAAPPKKKVKEGIVPLKILYGSQTGTAEDFSRTLSDEAKKLKFDVEVVDLENFNIDQFEEAKNVMLIVATYGDGEPTDNAKEFYDSILSEEHPKDILSGVKFTVFGLGNKTYPHFNSVSRTFDRRMEELGGKRIFERGEGDDDGSLEEDFSKWKKRMWPALCEQFGLEVVATSTDEAVVSRSTLEFIDAAPPISETSPNNNGYDPKNPLTRPILVNRELHSPSSDRSCRHIEIDISGSSYEPGDHLAVYPENEENIINETAKVLGVLDDLDKFLVLKKEGSIVLGPCTLRHAFTSLLDISSLPRKNLLKILPQYTTDPKEKSELALLASDSDQGVAKYNEVIKVEQRIFFEILAPYPSCKPPLHHILESLPKLQPRYYSISSSLKAHPDRVHITSVVVRFKTPTGRIHNGVASSWLAKQVPENGKNPVVKVFLRKSSFHLPKEPSLPIIMIGPGTGFAPFRGFIQERTTSDAANNTLFFGCRNRDVDFLYKDEILKYEEEKTITLFTAFSREQEEKIYVTHQLENQLELVASQLQRGAILYVCGEKGMSENVRLVLKKIVVSFLKNVGEKTHDAAADQFLEDLSKVGRYLQDVW